MTLEGAVVDSALHRHSERALRSNANPGRLAQLLRVGDLLRLSCEDGAVDLQLDAVVLEEIAYPVSFQVQRGQDDGLCPSQSSLPESTPRTDHDREHPEHDHRANHHPSPRQLLATPFECNQERDNHRSAFQYHEGHTISRNQ